MILASKLWEAERLKPLMAQPAVVSALSAVLEEQLIEMQTGLQKTAISALADTTGAVRNSGLVLYGAQVVLTELQDVLKRLKV